MDEFDRKTREREQVYWKMREREKHRQIDRQTDRPTMVTYMYIITGSNCRQR